MREDRVCGRKNDETGRIFFLRMIRAEFGMAVRKRGFQITFLLLFAYAMWVTVYYMFEQQGYATMDLYHPALLSGLNGYCEGIGLFYTLYPFLVVFSGSFLIFNDEKTQMNIYLFSRAGRFRYSIAKIVVCFGLTVMVMVLPFLIEMGVNLIVFPHDGGYNLSGYELFSETMLREISYTPFSGLYADHIYLYSILNMLLFGLFSGCAAVFVMGISTFRIRYRVLLLLPFYTVTWICAMINHRLGIPFLTYLQPYLFIGESDRECNYLYYFLLGLALLVCGILLVCRNVMTDRSEANHGIIDHLRAGIKRNRQE